MLHLKTRLLLLAAISLSTSCLAKYSMVTPNPLSSIDSHHISTKRLLRAGKTSYYDLDEERGVSGVSVESLSNSLKSTTNEQLMSWLNGGKNADDVFKLLTLDDAAETLLASPQLQAWIKFMKKFNTENPKQQTTLIKTLTSHYGDDGVAKIIEAAKQVPATATIAKRLQTEQTQRWIAYEKSPDVVFKLLKLNNAGDKLFKQPQVVTWAKYVDAFNKAHPEQKTTLFSMLKKYDEQTLVDMLIAAQKVPATEKIAVRVQADLTNAWLSIQKSPNAIFKLLKLDMGGDALLESPLFVAWTKYTDYYNLMYHKETFPVISTLTKNYPNDKLASILALASMNPSTESLASQLQRELLENWYKQGNAPSYVFKRLQLDKTGERLFDSPILDTWRQYVDYFRRRKPKQKVNMLAILKEHYKDDGVLAKMLVEASEVSSTKTMATDLLDAFTLRWMYNRESPTNVYQWLRVEGTSKDNAIRKMYENYDQLYQMKYA
ncbi:secreted RxLR effector peptide protein, putative [Phytophthora infestans T30-4]|uniref:Secreted RxLR effector peptide protein, putative n=3 Tax=Phytophthora infestans TaxID=4787 RepID=D0NRR8_PHYIT|nr:secreted RxLR effector peptide protein, putative [Phytophthora infestans T30-4]EEY63418.1 secreted RxLR effector peptide protein, putative [Phytophthora infestans T30-4]KAF4046862.1 hypothetical protein GN244_ATG00690 [Phytophthora infestans]|eukprot:XP_002898303.1 secreted RxLR effector peptide protein, putative [Phytophthora infestans T30-4]